MTPRMIIVTAVLGTLVAINAMFYVHTDVKHMDKVGYVKYIPLGGGVYAFFTQPLFVKTVDAIHYATLAILGISGAVFTPAVLLLIVFSIDEKPRKQYHRPFTYRHQHR